MQYLNPIRLCIICTFLASFASIRAQHNSTPPDKTEALLLYHQTFDNEFKFINGREYKPYHHPTQDNPFLNSTSGIGSIYMDGKEYTGKQLTYDIYKDLLIVVPDYFKFSNVYVQLKKSEIDSFAIHFDKEYYQLINFKKQQCPPGLEPGFYQRIYKSDITTLLIKHYVIRGVNNAQTTYRYQTDRFILLNGNSYNVSTKKKLAAIFPKHKKQIKRKIKSINYSYKKMDNAQLFQVIQFIDTL